VGTLISPIVRTQRDIAGNEYTDVYSIFEYTSAGILPTGESIDLSPYMRRVELVTAQPISGALLHLPRPIATDFPGNAGSGRMGLFYIGSGAITVSGFINAGVLTQTPLLSGVAVSGTRAYIHAFGY
jgi:hypothetical protein